LHKEFQELLTHRLVGLAVLPGLLIPDGTLAHRVELATSGIIVLTEKG
jgi:hypothetical protein